MYGRKHVLASSDVVLDPLWSLSVSWAGCVWLTSPHTNTAVRAGVVDVPCVSTVGAEWPAVRGAPQVTLPASSPTFGFGCGVTAAMVGGEQ